MIFNREEECTNVEKEYYDTIGIYTGVLSGIFLLMISSILFNNHPNFNTIYLLIISVAFIVCNIILSVNIWDKLKKNMLLMFIFTPSILYSLITLWFTGFLFFKQETISDFLRNMLYIPCFINIIILLSIWIFGSCNKINHDCNVESWPEEFKSDALKSGREDFCNNLNETCMDGQDKSEDKSEDKCGSCSDSNYNNKDDCTDNNNVWTSRYTKCFWSKPSDKKVTSCDITTNSDPLEVHEGSCVYDLDKCSSINCNDFQPTTIFYDCCEENTLGWEENMDCDTLRSQIEANKIFHNSLKACKALVPVEEQDGAENICRQGPSTGGSCQYNPDGLPGEKCVSTIQGRIGEGSQRAGELEAEYNLRVAASSQTSNIHNQDLYE